VHQLEMKVVDIVGARCNHEDLCRVPVSGLVLRPTHRPEWVPKSHSPGVLFAAFIVIQNCGLKHLLSCRRESSVSRTTDLELDGRGSIAGRVVCFSPPRS